MHLLDSRHNLLVPEHFVLFFKVAVVVLWVLRVPHLPRDHAASEDAGGVVKRAVEPLPRPGIEIRVPQEGFAQALAVVGDSRLREP